MGFHAEESSSDSDSSSNASTSEFNPRNSPSAQRDNVEHPTSNGLVNGIIPKHDQAADTSSDDVSMSADSDSDDSISSKQVTTQEEFGNVVEAPGLAPDANSDRLKVRKRRHTNEENAPAIPSEDGMNVEARKRSKIQKEPSARNISQVNPTLDKSRLPAEIWHSIFTFCPPRVLGSLLRVNKSFNSYLNPSVSALSPPPSHSGLKYLSADEIWRSSRKSFLTGAPGPLLGHSELQMWQLVCGRVCEFCGKVAQINGHNTRDLWHAGPGEHGVVPVWAFGVRACGGCIKQKSIKEIDLLLSSVIPSPLMTALPFIFLSSDLHVISSHTLQVGQHPTSVQITKQFWGQHVDDIREEFQEVQKLGSAAVEEWLKGLDGVGRQRRADAGRWEKWESNGGVLKMREIHAFESFPGVGISHAPQQPTAAVPNAVAAFKPQIHNPQNLQSMSIGNPPKFLNPYPPPKFDSTIQPGAPIFIPRPQNQPKQERTKEEVADLKAARRAEIERRCMLLDPPLTAEVLAHMTSFQAAIQIIQPLTDSAWEVLKPRLLSQRDDAERREKARVIQMRHIQEQSGGPPKEKAAVDPNDQADGEWEDVQAPLRTRIGGYADEIIRDGWNAGDKVNFDSAPLFAAEVLIYVRKRFYAEVAKDEAAMRATGRQPELDPANGPFTKKLILENMKWIFDSKIKPITELHRKELFLCNACDFPSKYYGFEGIIQHFAAKHTNTLSIGSVVVHWKSEWPQHPPFNPEPNPIKPGQVTANLGIQPAQPIPHGMTHAYPFGGYHPTPGPAYTQAPAYHQSPGPYFGHPQFESHPQQTQGPYPAPPYPAASQPYQPAHFAPFGQHNVPDYAPVNYQQQIPGVSSAGIHAATNPSQSYPITAYDPNVQPPYTPEVVDQYGPTPTHVSSGYEDAGASQRSELYRIQLQQLARDARDIWYSLSGLKEVPGSAKVFTVIYHLLNRFREAFQEDPPLSMLVDGLNNNKDMRPVRNVNGLVCKACSLGLLGSANAPDKKHFSFPQLANHFHSIHEEGVIRSGAGPIPDWTKDMVELPEPKKLEAIPRARGIDDQKLKIIAEALPEIFARPVSSHNDQPEADRIADHSELAPSQDNHDRYYSANDPSKLPENIGVVYATDEYDPKNPRDILVESRPARRSSLMDRRLYDGENGHSVHQDIQTTRLANWSDNREFASQGNGYKIDDNQPYSPSDQDTLSRRFYGTARQDDLTPHNVEPRSQKNHISDVVAQIQHQASMTAQEQQHTTKKLVGAGPEDGEVSTEPRPSSQKFESTEDGCNAAERFLDDFRPGESALPRRIRLATNDVHQGFENRGDTEYRPGYQIAQRRIIYDGREPGYRNDERYLVREEVEPNGRRIQRAPSRQSHSYPVDEHHITSHPSQVPPRDRSPELVDRRFKVNNVIYRDERQSSARRTPSRYARYESVRLENDRLEARSRSPIYVQEPAQPKDRSGSPLVREPVYRTRSPVAAREHEYYERVPQRQEVYRVYTDRPQPREPIYEEVFEYIRVSDPQGDYMIRRPVRRRIEPIYASERYEAEEVYVRDRRPVYEARPRQEMPPAQQPDLEEEYDPRHPEPLVDVGTQRVRYQ